jgi:predicted metal-binding protein
MKKDFNLLIAKALAAGASEARLIAAKDVVFDPRSFLKCRFGCNRWGRYWTCPPHLGLSPERFKEAYDRYTRIIVIKSADPAAGQAASLAVEKTAMLTLGCVFAFALTLCVQCDECAYPEPCRHPHLARPSMDAFGIDLGKTLAPLGFEVAFDPHGKLLPAWYSMVLLD